MSSTILLLKNAKLLDPKKLEIYHGNILIEDGLIKDVLNNNEAEEIANFAKIIDLTGRYLAPGLIESHMHIESTMLTPAEFARHAIINGTTTIFVDPHELANVFGTKAIDLFINQSKQTPLEIFIGIPSCVPATHMEDAGSTITCDDIEKYLPYREIYGLGEMMNFPGIIYNLGDARQKVDLAFNAGKNVDGHCPGISDRDLETYISNGYHDNSIRISSDHEATTGPEALARAKAGMTVAIRQGSATYDMDSILPWIIKNASTELDSFMLCSDDLDCLELAKDGHLNRLLKKATSHFKDANFSHEEALLRSLRMLTYIPGKHYQRFFTTSGYAPCGSLEKGQRANIIAFDNLQDLNICHSFINGERCFNDEDIPAKNTMISDYFKNSVHLEKKLQAEEFKIKTTMITPCELRIIQIQKNSLLTTETRELRTPQNGEFPIHPEDEISKIAIFERHHSLKSHAIALVKGFHLQGGAIASTIAHDSHNLIMIGNDDQQLARLGNALAEVGGGLGVLDKDGIHLLPLEIGGLMWSGTLEELIPRKRELLMRANNITNHKLDNPFMTLSFLALPVIPSLKLTNRGLVDVNNFTIVSIEC